MDDTLKIPITQDAYSTAVKAIESIMIENLKKAVKELAEHQKNKNSITTDIIGRAEDSYSAAIELSKVLSDGGNHDNTRGPQEFRSGLIALVKVL